MAELIARGATITLDALFRDATGALVDAVNPRVSIVDASGATVVNLATPTNVGTGHEQYDYPVATDAQLGAWAARWFGVIDGAPVNDEDGFTVVTAESVSVGVAGGVTCEPWATSVDAPASLDAADPVDVDEAFQVASDMLYELTRRRYPGRCTETIRPQAQWRKVDGPPRWWSSVAGSSSPFGWCSCHRGRETGCSSVPELKLPGNPVVVDSIVVKIDGDEFADFRLDDHRYLVRTDGHGWPCCQRLVDEDTEVGTWSVRYSYGSRPPVGGKRAAISLGTQLFLAYNPTFDGANACRLPKRVTSITRAGTTIAILDPLTLFSDGRTGLAEVDEWVAFTNLGVARRGGAVIVPGRWRGARRTGR